MRWLRYIAVVITLGDWFQTEYSLSIGPTEHGKSNRIEIAIFLQNRIEIDRLAKISYRHSTNFKYSADHSLKLRFPPVTRSDLYLETV